MLTGRRINTLPRQEIARGKSNLSELFASGHRLKGKSIAMFDISLPSERAGKGARVRALFTVGKKLVPGAVERNRIKRLMREAYRLEKSAMGPGPVRTDGAVGREVIMIAFLYRGRRDIIPSLMEFREEMRRLLPACMKKAGRTAPDGDER